MSGTGSEGEHGDSAVLRRAQRAVERWRARHGGPGVRIPERLWSLAVEVARSEGVGTTARCLGLDRRRLTRRVGLDPVADGNGQGKSGEAAATFVELRLSEPQSGCKAVLELSGGDGELLRMVVSDVRQLDVLGLALAFWSRRR